MEYRLSVPGRYDRLAQLCQFVSQAATDAGLTDDDIHGCQLAVDEACTNIIEHGYAGENRGTIDLACRVGAGELTITIHDHAQRFDPEGVPAPTLSASLEELKVGGLGLHFMREVMDAVAFSYTEGGNQVVLVKRRTGDKSKSTSGSVAK